MASLGCPNCADWPDAREGLSKYDGYCATCFKHCFPEDIRSTEINPMSREQRVRDAIIANFRDKGFIFNRPLHTKGGGCDCPSRRRIDNYVFLNGTILAVEVDEEAHQTYNQNDEKNRYDELLTDYGGKMVYIRFNPDPTSDDRSDLEDRLKPLMTEIEKQMGRIQREENKEIVEIIYMYYPGNKGDKRGRGSACFKCEHCGAQFAHKTGLLKHHKSARYCLEMQGKTAPIVQCVYCSGEFANRTNLDIHQLTCLEKKQYEYAQKLGEMAQKITDLTAQLEEQKLHYEEKIEQIHKSHHEVLIRLLSQRTMG